MLALKIEKREGGKKAESIRKGGNIPAVFYGRKEESTPILVNTRDFEKVFREAGESTIIVLEGVGEPHEALIQDVDVHPVTGKVRHADFYVIEKGKKLDVSVPLEFVGESSAVNDLGGILVKVMHELNIEALPKDLPHEIIVDVTSLVDFESQIAVKDLPLPDGVTALVDAEEIVAMITEPKEEEEEPTEIDMDSIEVEGEKDDDEGAAEKEETRAQDASE